MEIVIDRVYENAKHLGSLLPCPCRLTDKGMKPPDILTPQVQTYVDISTGPVLGLQGMQVYYLNV